MDYKNLGMRMQQARESRKITQSEMANYCGLSKNYISALERGVNNPSAETIINYADKCEMSLDELVGRVNAKEIIPELKRLLMSMDLKQQKKMYRIIQSIMSDE